MKLKCVAITSVINYQLKYEMLEYGDLIYSERFTQDINK